MATSSVRDGLALSAENQVEKGTGVMALLVASAAKWAIMVGMSDDQELVGERFMTL